MPAGTDHRGQRGSRQERDDRLEDLVAEIRAQEGISMGALAERLGVTVRTVRRDVRTLRLRGFEIEADRGRGGGIRFARSAPLPPLRLDTEQAVSLWLSVEIARRVSGLPFSHGSRAALNKVQAALPPERRAQLRQLCRRIILGVPATEAMRESFGVISPSLLDVFERCFREGVCMGYRYVDRQGNETHRCIEPHGIFIRLPFWYILAIDVEVSDASDTSDASDPSQAERMFRMDRISNPRAMNRRFETSGAVVEAMVNRVPYEVLAPPTDDAPRPD